MHGRLYNIRGPPSMMYCTYKLSWRTNRAQLKIKYSLLTLSQQMKNRCWSMALLYKSRISVWHRVWSLTFWNVGKNVFSIRKKCPQTTQEQFPHLGECTHWQRNEHCLWHEVKYTRCINDPLLTFTLQSKTDLINFDISDSKDSLNYKSCALSILTLLWKAEGGEEEREILSETQ